MLRLVKGILSTLVVVFALTIGVGAVQNDTDYVPVQVTIEIRDIETGELVSREYFDVNIPSEELEEPGQYHAIEPFNTLSRRRIPILGGSIGTNVGLVSAPLLAENRRINYYEGNVRRVNVLVETATMGHVLGRGTLQPGQSMTVFVNILTVSYNVFVSSSDGTSGFGYFSVTR